MIPKGRNREGFGINELGDEATGEVKGNETLKAADAVAANEEGRDGGVVGDGRDLVVVEGDDGGVDPHGVEEVLHDMAHAARWTAENHHRILGN